MSNDNVFKLIQPGAFDNKLTEILRQGARTLLAQAVEAEVSTHAAQRISAPNDLSDAALTVMSGSAARSRSHSSALSRWAVALYNRPLIVRLI
jgi:hypothetical protein